MRVEPETEPLRAMETMLAEMSANRNSNQEKAEVNRKAD
jgi:hypothetical protein